MRRALCPVLVVAILWVGATGAAASGRVDTVVAEAWVEDRFGDDCAQPLAGACVVDATVDPQDPGSGSVDAYQSIHYVGVATNFSTLEETTGQTWLLPDQSVTMRGQALYVRYPFIRAATETWQNVSQRLPRHDNYSLEMSKENVTLYYASNYADHPREVRQRNFSVVYAREDQDGVGYEKAGPVHALGDTSSDSYVDQVARAMCKYRESDPGCTSTAHNLANETHGATPNVAFGRDFYDVEVATDPQELDGPSSVRAGASAAPPMKWRPNQSALSVPKGGPPHGLGERPSESPPATPRPGAPENPGSNDVAPHPARTQAVNEPIKRRPLSVVVIATTAVGLALFLAAIFYSRFIKQSDLLHLDTRRKLLDLVQDEPGICTSEAARRLGVTRNAVKYHVRMLGRMNLIQMVVAKGQRTLYLPGVRPVHGPAAFDSGRFWAHPVRRRVKAALAASVEGLTRQNLHQLLADVPVRTRNHVLKGLIARGLVEEVSQGPAPKLRLVS